MLLATALDERDALRGIEVEDMVRRALGYIARTGPSTGQDRWEENEGINAFTLAVCIAALVAGAALLPEPECDWALALADFWNEQIEAWTTVSGTELARQYGVPGYYLRVAPPGIVTEAGASTAIVPIRNRRGDGGLRGDQQIGTEFLQLVRFGLRRADDPLILGSLKLADALLRTDTPAGPVWHRYLGDGYGEHDGRPRLRRHRHRTRLAAVDRRARALRDRGRQRPAALSRGDGGDGEPRRDDPGAGVGCRADPRRRLFPGRASGSAMPLAWAHAEFVKLLMSRQINRPFDRPRAMWQRYRGRRPVATHAFWWPHAPIGAMRAGAKLAVALPFPGGRALGPRRLAADRRDRQRRQQSRVPCRRSRHGALPPGSRVDFTWRRQDDGEWAGARSLRLGSRSRAGGPIGCGAAPHRAPSRLRRNAFGGPARLLPGRQTASWWPLRSGTGCWPPGVTVAISTTERATFSTSIVGSTMISPLGCGTPRVMRCVISVRALPTSIWPHEMS